MTDTPNAQMFHKECDKCKEALSFTVPSVLINNHPAYSQILLIHEIPQSCPKCGMLYACIINDLNGGINLAFRPLKQQTQPSNIIAPTNSEVIAVQRGKDTEAKIAIMPGAK